MTGFDRKFALLQDRLVGLVVKASASRAKVPGFVSRLRRGFSASSNTSDLKLGTPVATLPGAGRYKLGTPVATLPDAGRYWVSTGTGQPGVSTL